MHEHRSSAGANRRRLFRSAKVVDDRLLDRVIARGEVFADALAIQVARHAENDFPGRGRDS